MSDNEVEAKTHGIKRTRSSSGTLSLVNEDDSEMRLESQETREYLNPIVYIEYDPSKYDDNAPESSNSKLAAQNPESFKQESFVSLKPQTSKSRITRSMSRSLPSNKAVAEKVTLKKTASDKDKAVSKKAASSRASSSVSSIDSISSAKERKSSDQQNRTNSQRLQLLDAVLEEIDVLNWETVAEKVDGKSSRSCRNQWKKMIGDLRSSLTNDK
ncbi:17592_t:CDS:1 [Acaulospora colombiana]|uniref:17592_t:CDS:1 n=1 Tax=Acaulospora colombiana TaxID=27376 RepID=A0ACA9K8X8_9GLOM|nr:17592_t:CDS:1 [Acaulospora colombiana]